MHDYCAKYWDDNRIVSPPLYGARASEDHGVLSYPSATGGPNWGGGSYDPGLGLYFINVQNIPTFHAAVGHGGSLEAIDRSIDFSAMRAAGKVHRRHMPPFSFPPGKEGYLPCAATPWGELVAVDLRHLSIAWRIPLGVIDALGSKPPATGAPNLGGSIVTASGVIFIGASNDHRFRAFDARTGRKLWEAQLEASAHATPITYLGKDGRQYVVVAAAGGTSAAAPHTSDTLVAFALN
jgi:quinoprotein glucose dehydrogenase